MTDRIAEPEVRCACGKLKVAHTAKYLCCPSPNGFRILEKYTPVNREDLRIERLIQVRGLSKRGAEIVVRAAMYGIGCVSKEFKNLPAAEVMV